MLRWYWTETWHQEWDYVLQVFWENLFLISLVWFVFCVLLVSLLAVDFWFCVVIFLKEKMPFLMGAHFHLILDGSEFQNEGFRLKSYQNLRSGCSRISLLLMHNEVSFSWCTQIWKTNSPNILLEFYSRELNSFLPLYHPCYPCIKEALIYIREAMISG